MPGERRADRPRPRPWPIGGPVRGLPLILADAAGPRTPDRASGVLPGRCRHRVQHVRDLGCRPRRVVDAVHAFPPRPPVVPIVQAGWRRRASDVLAHRRRQWIDGTNECHSRARSDHPGHQPASVQLISEVLQVRDRSVAMATRPVVRTRCAPPPRALSSCRAIAPDVDVVPGSAMPSCGSMASLPFMPVPLSVTLCRRSP